MYSSQAHRNSLAAIEFDELYSNQGEAGPQWGGGGCTELSIGEMK